MRITSMKTGSKVEMEHMLNVETLEAMANLKVSDSCLGQNSGTRPQVRTHNLMEYNRMVHGLIDAPHV